MGKLRVLLVDDHTVVRNGLRKLLEATGELIVVGEVGDGTAAVTEAERLAPDVVVMDVGLPGINGIEATRRILAAQPGTPVLILSMHADLQYIRQSVAAGARGYVLKDADAHEVATAVLAVCSGKEYFADVLSAAVATGDSPPSVLSLREREVLARICAGLTNREVATDLGLSVSTVETHRKHIVEKLDLHSTAELVRYGIRHRIAM